MIGDKTAIVGVGTSKYYPRGQSAPLTQMQLAIEAILAALNDAGLTMRDVDGFSQYCVHHGIEIHLLAPILGVPDVKFSAGVTGGGNGTAGSIIMAADAIGQMGKQAGAAPPKQGSEMDFMKAFGKIAPGHIFAPYAMRHQHLYGTRREAYAQIAVQQRANANRRPTAIMYDKPMTKEDYFNARMICEPFCLFDFCLEIDGAAAVVVTSAERAKSLRQKPIYIKAGVQGGGVSPIMPDPVVGWAGQKNNAKRLYEMAGVGPKDIDVAEMYEAFTPQVLWQLEDYGFCPVGESGPFVEEGRTAWPNGDIPVNTHGGHLSDSYLMGMTHVVEAVEQLRGTAINQVEGAELALVTGGPASLPQSALLLRR